ncbi:MAG: hypothetical protein V4622_04240 [Bacteroidota bacterium]
MKSIFTFLTFVFICFLGFSQVDVILDIKAADWTTGKKLAGVSIDVFDGANNIKSVVTPSNGVVKITIPSGKKYKVELSKPGKVSRFFYVDSKGINAEAIQGGSSVNRDLEVNLFDEIQGVDFSYVETNPFTELYFEGNPKLSFDEAIAGKMKKKIDDLLKQAEKKESENEAKYQEAMAKAKDWYGKKNWQFALDKYIEASTLKPSEQEPKDKIKELDALLKKQQTEDLAGKQKEEEYQKIIASANALQQQKKYGEAISKYEEALKIKDEQYVRDQIKDLKGFLDKEKKDAENENKYKLALKNGDDFANQTKFADAKTQYNEALKIKPNDPVATKKLADLELKIKEQGALAEKKKKYDAAIAAADLLLSTNKLSDAKAKYQEALGIDNTQTYPTTKIKEIDAKIADEAKNKEKTEKYNLAMKAADDLFNANKLAEAKAKYLEASKIDVSQTKPSENIAKIDKLLADQADALKKKELEAKISTLLKDAGALYSKKELENAKKKYQDVLALDATNSEATTKIAEINAKIASNNSEADKLKKFNELKTKGLSLMQAKKWTEAKQTLLEAKSYKADGEIDVKLKEIDAEIEKENAKLGAEQLYSKTIEEAKSLENSNIDASILKYKEALKLKPNEAIPTAKIKELEVKKLANSSQAETDKKYNEAMKKGDEFLSAKNYTKAIEAYNQALAIKPSEKEPVNKANEAKRLSEDVAKGEAFAQYQKILNAGQKAIDEKDWTKAKDMYNRAIKLDPNDAIPKNKLKEIDALIKAEEDAKKGSLDKENTYKNKISEAELAVKSKEYDKAISLLNDAKNLKPSELLPSKRIKEIEDLKAKELSGSQAEKMYADYMSKGNAAQNSKDYSTALTEFKNALGVKANDKNALAKISEVQQLIDNEKNNQADAEFNNLVKEGDALFAQDKWSEAKDSYEKALKLKNDFDTKKKYDKCIKNIKNKPDEDIQYNKIINKADGYFDSKDYEKAKELYERAISLKSSDSYPKDKLKEIERILNPVVIQPAGPLANLGIPTTEDIAKVNEQLIKDQNTRKSKREGKLKNKKDKIQDKTTESVETKTEELLTTANEISTIEKKNSENYVDGDENRQGTVETVQNSNKSISTSETEAQTLKYNESLNNAEQVKNITSENAQIYSKSELVYTDNTEKVKTVQQNNETQNTIQNNVSYSQNLDSQNDLSKKSKQIDEKVIDDFESRKVIEEQVKTTNKNISANDYKSTTEESTSILNLSVKLEGEDKGRAAKTNEENKVYGNNSEKVKTIDKKIVQSDLDQNTKLVEKSLASDKILNNKQSQINKLPTEQDVNRQENVEGLKTGENKINENTRVEYNKNVVKALQNQGNITKVEQNTVIAEQQETLSSQKMNADIDGIDKKAVIATNERIESDDLQRQNTLDGVNNSEKTILKQNTEKAKKVDENISGVQNVSNTISSEKNKEDLTKTESLTNAQVLLSKISSKEVKYDDKVANELGTLYPEGVSQEVFNQNDEDGLLVAVITRRVVVKKGHGQIYIRTQSLSGLTYSKNGEPSSEFVWQKETQDAKLTKNYK